MKKFNKWFEENLKISRYPTPKECVDMEQTVIINVSDEWIPSCATATIKSGKEYYWFPMNECSSSMGINSIYATLQILYLAEQEGKKVYLHCHAGVNRSPTVAECYYRMRTGEWLEEHSKRIRVVDNIKAGHLPCVWGLEIFLKECMEGFQKEETMRGGYLDKAKSKARVD